MPGFELIARAVITKDDRILVCRGVGKENYFFPGGHIEWGEGAAAAVQRELREELGLEAVVGECIGLSENYYTVKDTEHHEMNVVFAATILDGEVHSQEKHLEFTWVKKDELSALKVFPLTLKQAVLAWWADKNRFWTSEIEPNS